MSANGIAWLVTKQAKQEAKLEIAEAKRQGKIVTEESGTYSISGSIDPTKPYYREHNVLEIDELPTKYIGDDTFDNLNLGGLVQGRPWINE